jgi:hypothetical protein
MFVHLKGDNKGKLTTKYMDKAIHMLSSGNKNLNLINMANTLMDKAIHMLSSGNKNLNLINMANTLREGMSHTYL